MKKILILLLIIISYAYSEPQTRAISNWQKKNLYSRELIKQNKIKYIFTAIVPSKKSDFYNGRLTKRETYDTTGKLISSSEYEAYSDSIYSTYEYDAEGYLIQIVKQASENNVLTITYTYDSTGKILRITNYGSERKDYGCVYNSKGNLIVKKGYAYYPKFDEKGNIIPNENDIVLVDEIKYKYDKHNNLIKEQVKINGKLIRTTRYKYDKNNLKIEEINKYLGNRVKYKYKYDKDKKLTEFIRYNINGSKSYFKVEYEYYE